MERDREHLSLSTPKCVSALNLAFVEDVSEWFVAFWAVKETDFKLHSFARFVWSSSHSPLLLWCAYFSSTLWTLSHVIFSSIVSGYVGLTL